MTDQQKVDALTQIRQDWNGNTDEGYIPLSLQALTSLYNQQYQTDLLNGSQVIDLIGYMDDYVL